MTVKRKAIPSPKTSSNRHESHCTICSHPERQEIEREFIGWKSPAIIATEFKLGNRSAVYRHAHALNLVPKRARNLRGALERIIEKADDVRVSASAIVQAIALYARINAQGELVERDELVSYHDLFAQMNADELKAYAEHGTLPSWFPRTNVARNPQGSGGDENV